MTEIKNLAIIGAGQMGAGIGLVAAFYDYNITFYDIKQEFIDAGIARNKKYIDRQVSKERISQEEADK